MSECAIVHSGLAEKKDPDILTKPLLLVFSHPFHGLSYMLVTLLIKWPRQEAYSGRILACFEHIDQQMEGNLER